MNNENPFAAPATTSPEFAPPSEARMMIASRGKRFANLFVDNIVIQILAGGCGFAFGILYVSMVGPGGYDEFTLTLYGYAIGFTVSFAYFVLSETFLQRTIAKYLTGTMVVNESGGPPTLGQIMGRSLCRFIPFEAFSFLSDNNPVGWHDSISKTRVIDVSK